MSVSAKIEAKNYVTEVVEEELYAGSNTIPLNSASPVKVGEGRIPDGFDGVAIGIGCTQSASCSFFLKIADKQFYPNGLNTGGLGGLSDETLLLVKIGEKVSWEIGLTNISGGNIVLAWRFRVRLFRR